MTPLTSKNALCILTCLLSSWCFAEDRLNILDFGPGGSVVDRTAGADSSGALDEVVKAANNILERGNPICVYLPAGKYRIVRPPRMFVKAGCIRGDGPTQSIILLDPQFTGNVFSWSEAWGLTTPGPTITGVTIQAIKRSTKRQDALVFYDRNDNVDIEDVNINNLNGRGIYSGVTLNSPIAYMRESRIRSVRMFLDGAPGVPVIEFNSEGRGNVDATNHVQLTGVDVYGPYGAGFVIRNNGDGVIRTISAHSLRVEGIEDGNNAGDLVMIGDNLSVGRISSLEFDDIELVDPYRGYSAFHVDAPQGAPVPFSISLSGSIGGGLPNGKGINIQSGRLIQLRISAMYTKDTNVVIGPRVNNVYLDGAGQERCWTYEVDPAASRSVFFPQLLVGVPNDLNAMPVKERCHSY